MVRIFLLIFMLLAIGKSYSQSMLPVFFLSGSSTLADSSSLKLSGFLSGKDPSKYMVYVEGHTDSISDPALNFRLSGKRAENVVSELLKSGVPLNRIHVSHWGEDFPAASNNTEAGRAANRRVEIYFVPDNNIQQQGNFTLNVAFTYRRDSLPGQIIVEDLNGKLLRVSEINPVAGFTNMRLDKEHEYMFKMITPGYLPWSIGFSYNETINRLNLAGISKKDTLSNSYINFTLIGTRADLHLMPRLNDAGNLILTERERTSVNSFMDEKTPYYYVFEWVEINPETVLQKPKQLQIFDATLKAQQAANMIAPNNNRVFYNGKVVYNPGASSRTVLFIRKYSQ